MSFFASAAKLPTFRGLLEREFEYDQGLTGEVFPENYCNQRQSRESRCLTLCARPPWRRRCRRGPPPPRRGEARRQRGSPSRHPARGERSSHSPGCHSAPLGAERLDAGQVAVVAIAEQVIDDVEDHVARRERRVVLRAPRAAIGGRRACSPTARAA